MFFLCYDASPVPLLHSRFLCKIRYPHTTLLAGVESQSCLALIHLRSHRFKVPNLAGKRLSCPVFVCMKAWPQLFAVEPRKSSYEWMHTRIRRGMTGWNWEGERLLGWCGKFKMQDGGASQREVGVTRNEGFKKPSRAESEESGTACVSYWYWLLVYRASQGLDQEELLEESHCIGVLEVTSTSILYSAYCITDQWWNGSFQELRGSI